MSPTIVCAIEDSARSRAALRVSAEVADRLGMSMVGVHVIPPAAVTTAAGLPHPVVTAEQHLERRERAAAERAEEVLREAGLDEAPIHTAYGSASEVLLGAAEEEDAAMVALATTGAGFVRTLLEGSVTGALLRLAPVPVLAISPQAQAAPARGPVVAAVAGPADASWIPVAERLALAHGGELVLAHVIEGGEDAADDPALAEASSRFDAFDPALEALGTTELLVGMRVCFGAADEALRALAGACDASVLVAGSRGHGTLRAAMVGSTARRLVANAEIPVVVCPRNQKLAGWRAL
jgi:nucleotide-binding universal stress UspA family protein